MRVMQSDIAILNAAQYEDGPAAERTRPPGGALQGQSSVRRNTGSRKRPRTLLPDEPVLVEEEEKKRTRGRPRLEPTNQTPQDRRRTQIRLAQRAYRNRKESAISTLEKEVDGLKEVNDEMTEAYRKLFDYATRKGLLEQAPEFGEHLLRLEALAKRSGEHAAKGDDEASSSDGAHGSKAIIRKTSDSPPEIDVRSSLPQQHQTQQQPPFAQPQHLWGGLLLTHEPATAATTAATQHIHHMAPNMSLSHGNTNLGYEIIAQPTHQNASFAQTLSYDQSTIFGHMPAPSSWNSLPNPHTYAYQEVSFSRRLQRTALQRAARLITMDNPPPERLTRVFGLARLFETYEQIRERTLACLDRNTMEDLHYWKYPVQSVGGAGTHFPEMQRRGPELKTNGMNSPGSQQTKPGELAPFAMGPFDQHTQKIRESLIGLGNKMNLPGFDGVFWDPDEVDYYLIQNGVNIPALADHWVVEIEDGAFAGPPTKPSTQSHNQYSGPASISTASSNQSVSMQSAPMTMRTNSTATTTHSLSSPRTPNADMAMATNVPPKGWQSQYLSIGNGQAASIYSQMPAPPAMSSLGDNIAAGFSDPSLLSLGANNEPQPMLNVAGPQFQGIPNFAHVSGPRRKTWRINVEKFLDELISKAMCLGRTPGFKPRDIDTAFWASVVDPDTF